MDDRQPSPPPPASGPEDDRSVAQLVIDVSERLSILVREEVELAKTEVTEKATVLLKGSAVGIAAGVFVLLALAMLMHAIAWGINDLLGIESAIWAGFLIEAVVWLLVAALAGFLAYKAVRKGSPPKPEMAIAEAKLTRETLGGGK